ncbi:MAG: TerC/Alx family metal homeostasis membrane protein [Bacteroidales bacterium]|nr:TerC/Alx family metal homeostasis membrane protein [Bacteroidales bacterium]
MAPTLNEVVFFSLFLLFISLMLAVDLGVFNKKAHKQSFKEAIGWTSVWIVISVLFYLFLFHFGTILHGPESLDDIAALVKEYHHPIVLPEDVGMKEAITLYNRNLALEYLTGYLIEKSLSVDNVFVIILIFLSFNIRQEYYKKVLFWGILGAIVMRFIFIFAASALLHYFNWLFLFFGALLIILGGKMGHDYLFHRYKKAIDTQHHPVVKFASRWFSVTREDHGEKFWIKLNGKTVLTPLFVVLLIIEFTDVLFAVDSVPAVFSVTKDPYIVFFSNIFAILGLRALFFLLMNVISRFEFLKVGLTVLLAFVGLKMILNYFELMHLSTIKSLCIISGILFISIIISLIQNFIKKRRSLEN